MLNDDDRDRRLMRRARALRRHWRRILQGAGACATTAMMVSLFLPKIYQATTYLLVSESKIGAGPRDAAWQLPALLPTFIPFVDNNALIDQSIHKFGLDRPPYNLTVDRFRRRNYLDVRIPKSTRLLEISIEFPDAQLAASLANDLAQGAVEYNDRMNAADTVATREFLRKQLDEARDHLAQATALHLKIQREAAIEDREKELSILLGERERLTTRLGQLRLDFAQDESKSKSLQQALGGQPQTFLLKKSVTADPMLEREAEKLKLDDGPLSMTEESLNVTRQDIQQSLVTADANSAAEHAGIQAATERLQEVNRQVSQLLSTITTLRSQLDQADRNCSLLYEAVKNTTREYQEASVTVSSKSQDMKQLAPAMVPDRPIRPRIVLNTILAFFLGTLLSASIAVMAENYKEMRAFRPFSLEDEEEPAAVRAD